MSDWKESANKRRDARQARNPEEPKRMKKGKRKKNRPWVVYWKAKPEKLATKSLLLKRQLEWRPYKRYIKKHHAEEAIKAFKHQFFFGGFDYKIVYDGDDDD